MSDYNPASLPAITAVEVVLLDAFNPDHVDTYMKEAKKTAGTRASAVCSQKIAALWRELPPGEQMRCHTPKYGLRFLVDDAVICEASVCWKCNNVYGTNGGKEFDYSFDREADFPRKLLAEVQRTAGAPVNDREE